VTLLLTWTSPLCSHRDISSFPTISLVPASIQGQTEQTSIEVSKLTSLLSPQTSVKVEELVGVDDLSGGNTQIQNRKKGKNQAWIVEEHIIASSKEPFNK
jgi:hypothetical protein